MKSFNQVRIVGLLSVLSGFSVSQVEAQVNPIQQTQTNPTRADQDDPAFGAAMDTFSGIYQTPWFNEPSIRQQLQFNEAQYNQLNQSYQTNWKRYNEHLNQLSNDKTLNNQQREEHLNQLNESFYKSFSNSADTVVADPTARQRYMQLYYQYRGYGAFRDPEVQRQLNLSDEQRMNISDAQRDWNRQMRRFNRDFANDPDVVIKRYNESRPEYQERLKKILTPQQYTQWGEMTGSRFDIPANVYFDNGITTTTTAKPTLK